MRFTATCPVCGTGVACTETKDALSPLLTEAFNHIVAEHPEVVSRIGPHAITVPHISYRLNEDPKGT